MKTKKKVLIINQGYDNKNLGDLAIRQNINDLFSDLGYEADFAFFNNPLSNKTDFPVGDYFTQSKSSHISRDRNVSLKGFLLIPYWYFKYGKTIKEKLNQGKYDLVVIGGGQLFHVSGVNYPHRFAVAMFWWTYFVKKYSKADIYIVGVGVEGEFNKIENFLYKNAVTKASKIWVRDSYAKSTLEKNFGKKVTLVPDVAFYKSKNKQLPINVCERNTAAVGIYCYDTYCRSYNEKNISRDDYYLKWYQKILKFEERGLEIALFYTTDSDGRETYRFKEYISSVWNKSIKVEQIKNIEDIYSLYSRSAHVYSGRMHALILAIKFGCKTEGFLLSQKLRSFNEEYILKNVTSTELSDKIVHSFENEKI